MRTTLVLLLIAATGCGKSDGPAPHAAAPPDPPAPVETIPNPEYASWAKFKKGTRVVVRSTTSTEGQDGQTSTTTTSTLVEVAADFVAVETQTRSRRYDGHEENNPPSVYQLPKVLPLPPGAAGRPPGESGEETITVGGKEYRTTWHKGKDRNEGGEVSVQTWSSEDVPGRLVKSVARTSGVNKLTVIELVEVTTP